MFCSFVMSNLQTVAGLLHVAGLAHGSIKLRLDVVELGGHLLLEILQLSGVGSTLTGLTLSAPLGGLTAGLLQLTLGLSTSGLLLFQCVAQL